MSTAQDAVLDLRLEVLDIAFRVVVLIKERGT